MVKGTQPIFMINNACLTLISWKPFVWSSLWRWSRLKMGLLLGYIVRVDSWDMEAKLPTKQCKLAVSVGTGFGRSVTPLIASKHWLIMAWYQSTSTCLYFRFNLTALGLPLQCYRCIFYNSFWHAWAILIIGYVFTKSTQICRKCRVLSRILGY